MSADIKTVLTDDGITAIARSFGEGRTQQWMRDFARAIEAAVLAAQPSQAGGDVKPFAWATHHDEPMLFPTYKEAAMYCDADEDPIALGPITHPADADAVDAKIAMLQQAIEITLRENAHLADGDDCTLIHLKRAIAQSTEGEKG